MRRFAGTATGLVLALCAGAVAAQSLETVATTPAEPLLIESVVRLADGSLLLSSIYTGRVFKVAADGALTTLAETDDAGFYGLAADPARDVLYAVTAPRPGPGTGRPPESGVDRLNLTTGRLEGLLLLGQEAPALGDVTVGPSGEVFVADSKAARIFVGEPGGDLTLLVQLPDGASPQGMAVSADGRWLVFSDYRTGLHRIDLTAARQAPIAFAANDFQPLPAPEGAELRGIDGLVRYRDTIIAIQNGTRTPRVLRLTLTSDWSAVTVREALVEGPPLSEPTTGFIEGDSFVFVSRSQWTDFGPDGRPTSAAPAPAVISRLSLALAGPQQ